MRARKQAQKIWHLLLAWKSAGIIVLTMNRFHSRVIRAQTMLRHGLHHMIKVTRVVSERWILVEKEMIAADLSTSAGAASVSMANRGHLTSIPDSVRLEYVKANLRFLRRKWVEDYISWKHEMNAYHRQVAEWRYSKNAVKSLGGTFETTSPKHPIYPVFMPDDEEIAVMIHQCRKGIKPKFIRKSEPQSPVLMRI